MGTFTSESMLGVQMGTWISKSMFGFQNGYMAFQMIFDFSLNGTWFSKSMLDSPHGNMICQVDVGFPKWEHGYPNRCWMSIHTLGSNNGFKQWVQTWCDAQVWNDIDLLNDASPLCPPPPRLPSSPPFVFPTACHLQPLGNSIPVSLHNTAVEQISYLYILYMMMQALVMSTAWMQYCKP